MSYVVSFVKSFFAFCVGVVLILVFYCYVHIPVIPSISIYPIAAFLVDEKCRVFRMFFVTIGTLLGIMFYVVSAIMSIVHFPDYLNVLGIFFSFVTAFAFLSAGFTYFLGFKNC